MRLKSSLLDQLPEGKYASLYNSSLSPMIGLTALGLSLVFAGAWLHKRNKSRTSDRQTEGEIKSEGDTGGEENSVQEDLPEDHVVPEDGNNQDLQSKRLIQYFVFVFVLSVPIWVVSSILGNRLPIPINLPISLFLFVIPVITASILTYRSHGLIGVKELIRKAADYKKIRNKIWYLPALLLTPLIYYLSYLLMRWIGSPLPDPIQVPIVLAPVYFVAFFIGATCEELGWSGYAIDPMQDRWGALKASILLGLIWQIWHIIGDVQAENSATWIFWHSLYSIALRILIVWVYNNTGKSVFAAILVHTMDNVSWSLFPNDGSAYDPLYTAIFAGVAAAIVTIGWGAKTLSQFRYPRLSRVSGLMIL